MSLSSKSVRAAAVSAGLAFSCVLLFPVHAYSLESTADPIGTASVTQADSGTSSTVSDESEQQLTAEPQQPSPSAQYAVNQNQPTDSPSASEAADSEVGLPTMGEQATTGSTSLTDTTTTQEDDTLPSATDNASVADAPKETGVESERPSVSYDVHVQNVGWQAPPSNPKAWYSDGETAGTTGKSLRAEGIRIKLDSSLSGSITYQAHVQNVGWQAWVSDGELSGTTGKALRLEALRIALQGDVADRYSIYYRAHVQDYGWLGWTHDGASAGSAGLGLRLEALEIKLIEKSQASQEAKETNAAFIPKAALTASGHVQDVGWQQVQQAGIGTILTLGTTGKSKRLEAFRISISPDLVEGSELFSNAYISTIGWQADKSDPSTWKSGDSTVSRSSNGTTGKSLSLEAVQLRLSSQLSPYYEIYYRAHVEDLGWLDWTKDGFAAGTTGLGKRLEALQIRLQVKSSEAPGATSNSYTSEDLWSDVRVLSSTPSGREVGIGISTVKGRGYVFLPSFSNAEDTRVCRTAGSGTFSVSGHRNGTIHNVGKGMSIALSEVDPDTDADGTRTLFYQGDSYIAPQKLFLLQSSGIDAMFLTSDDPANKGRTYIESSADHSSKATGSMVLANADGGIVYDGALTQIKGRGNTTWSASKKPYQIKLADKCDLLETGNSDNRSKTWVLLASAYDPTKLFNAITFALGKNIGILTPEYRVVDLFYDGDYRGSYLLAEKVQVGSGRVDIHDLEKDVEKANAQVDLDSLERVTSVNAFGNQYRYVKGVTNPSDISGGYLVELDNNWYSSEASWFKTSVATFVVKSPEFSSKESMERISEAFQEALNNASNHIDAFRLDLDSLARVFLLNTFVRNTDFARSSTYYYVDKNSKTIYSGPIWDFDQCFGKVGNSAAVSSPAGNAYNKFNSVGWMTASIEQANEIKELWPEVRADINRFVSGADEDGNTSNFAKLCTLTSDSIRNDAVIWQNKTNIANIKESQIRQLARLKDWMNNRIAWMDSYIESL